MRLSGRPLLFAAVSTLVVLAALPAVAHGAVTAYPSATSIPAGGLARGGSAVVRLNAARNEVEGAWLVVQSAARVAARIDRGTLPPGVEAELRLLTAEYLRNALREEQRIAPEDARAIIAAIGQ